MAKLWYAREGKKPVVSWPNEKRPLAEFESLLGMKKEHYHGIDGPKFGRQDKQGHYNEPRYVVVLLSDGEGEMNGWKQGYYLLPLSAEEARTKLLLARAGRPN